MHFNTGYDQREQYGELLMWLPGPHLIITQKNGLTNVHNMCAELFYKHTFDDESEAVRVP